MPEKVTCFIGIDPGVKGAVAWLDNRNENLYWIARRRMTRADMLCTFQEIADDTDTQHCWMEKQGARSPGRVACYRIGESVGEWAMAALASDIGVYECLPRRWQGIVGCVPKRKEPYSQHKKRLHRLALQIFPKYPDMEEEVADAVLIAYATRLSMGPSDG